LGWVADFAMISLTDSELQWLKEACPYLTPEYLTYLSSYRYKPEQVKIKYIPVTSDNLTGRVEIEIIGPWVETILWEVPIMACLSESYFQSVVVDWNYDHQDGTRTTNPMNALLTAGRYQSSLTRKLRLCLKQIVI
jgi:nicotinate phosphoribosyltransferase